MTVLAECPVCHKKQSVRRKACKCGEDLDKAKRSKRVRFWIDYKVPGGPARREFVGTSIEDARTADGKRKVQKKENRIFDIKPEAKMTFKELTKWYMELEKVKALSSAWRVQMALDRFNEVFGDVIAGRIKPADLENYQAKRKAEGKADATIDQELGAAKAVVYKAFDNDKVGGDTLRAFKLVKKLLKLNANARKKILTKAEVDLLMEKASRHLRPIVAMGFYTGMRKGEIVNLTWDKVDMKARVIHLEASDTKDGEARDIPIMKPLYEILEKIPRPLHETHVFTFKGGALEDIRTGLKIACKEAGISYGRFERNGFVFHDLRHSFNTHMRKSGVPESVIMAITGHSTREMFDRYNTIDEQDARNAVDQLAGYFQKIDQSLDQGQISQASA